MLKENKRTWIITNIVVVLPVLIGVIFWNRLPDVMATHFGMNTGIPFGCALALRVCNCSRPEEAKYQRQDVSACSVDCACDFAGRCSCNVSDEPGISNGHYILYGTVCRCIFCRDWKLPAKSKTELHHRNQNSMDACK